MTTYNPNRSSAPPGAVPQPEIRFPSNDPSGGDPPQQPQQPRPEIPSSPTGPEIPAKPSHDVPQPDRERARA